MTAHSLKIQGQALQTVHMVSKSYAPGKPVSYVVLIERSYYRINGETLDYLYEGKTPEWCGIEPMEDDDDHDFDAERAAEEAEYRRDLEEDR